MKCKLIVCANVNGFIGNKGGLMYDIKTDLKNFKRLTTDNVVIMGRKTYESLPFKGGLPNRINIVITRDVTYNVEQGKNNEVFIAPSLETAVECANEYGKDIFIIGGASIYSQAMEKDLVDTIYLTEVIDDADGDAYFSLEWKTAVDKWKMIFQTDPQFNDPPYIFSVWKRI